MVTGEQPLGNLGQWRIFRGFSKMGGMDFLHGFAKNANFCTKWIFCEFLQKIGLFRKGVIGNEDINQRFWNLGGKIFENSFLGYK